MTITSDEGDGPADIDGGPAAADTWTRQALADLGAALSGGDRPAGAPLRDTDAAQIAGLAAEIGSLRALLEASRELYAGAQRAPAELARQLAEARAREVSHVRRIDRLLHHLVRLRTERDAAEATLRDLVGRRGPAGDPDAGSHPAGGDPCDS